MARYRKRLFSVTLAFAVLMATAQDAALQVQLLRTASTQLNNNPTIADGEAAWWLDVAVPSGAYITAASVFLKNSASCSVDAGTVSLKLQFDDQAACSTGSNCANAQHLYRSSSVSIAAGDWGRVDFNQIWLPDGKTLRVTLINDQTFCDFDAQGDPSKNNAVIILTYVTSTGTTQTTATTSARAATTARTTTSKVTTTLVTTVVPAATPASPPSPPSPPQQQNTAPRSIADVSTETWIIVGVALGAWVILGVVVGFGFCVVHRVANLPAVGSSELPPGMEQNAYLTACDTAITVFTIFTFYPLYWLPLTILIYTVLFGFFLVGLIFYLIFLFFAAICDGKGCDASCLQCCTCNCDCSNSRSLGFLIFLPFVLPLHAFSWRALCRVCGMPDPKPDPSPQQQPPQQGGAGGCYQQGNHPVDHHVITVTAPPPMPVMYPPPYAPSPYPPPQAMIMQGAPVVYSQQPQQQQPPYLAAPSPWPPVVQSQQHAPPFYQAAPRSQH